MMKSCRRRMQNGKSLQQPLCAMKSRCTYQISMSSIKRAGSMNSNQHLHASIKKKIMQHSATETRCFLFVFLNHQEAFQIPILPPLNGTLRSQTEGYTRLLIIQKNSTLPAVIRAYPLIKFQEKFQSRDLRVMQVVDRQGR